MVGTMKQNRVLITGASSGIGEGIANALARPGTTLVLVGRDAAGIARAAETGAQRGAAVVPAVLDVTDRDAMRRLIVANAPFDLVFANAGVAHGVGPDGCESEDQIRRIFAVNVDGVLNTVLPAVDRMLGAPPGSDGVRGRIAVTSSIAAFLPYPNTPAYCASKAAVDTWTVATGANLARHGILMTSVCPGFVRTRMTARNDFPMPGLMEVDRAVRHILRAVAAGRRRVVFPLGTGTGSRVVGLLPTWAREELLRRQPTKGPPALA